MTDHVAVDEFLDLTSMSELLDNIIQKNAFEVQKQAFAKLAEATTGANSMQEFTSKAPPSPAKISQKSKLDRRAKSKNSRKARRKNRG